MVELSPEMRELKLTSSLESDGGDGRLQRGYGRPSPLRSWNLLGLALAGGWRSGGALPDAQPLEA